MEVDGRKRDCIHSNTNKLEIVFIAIQINWIRELYQEKEQNEIIRFKFTAQNKLMQKLKIVGLYFLIHLAYERDFFI